MSEPSTDKIVQYWNERVARHGTSGGATLLDDNMRLLEIETATSWLDPGDRVLDIFCGNAATTIEIAKRCASVTGVDLSEAMLSAGRERLQKSRVSAGAVELKKVNVLELDQHFQPGSFDAVVSIRGLINLPTWPLQQQALRAIHGLLPAHGKLIFLEGSQDGFDRINDLRSTFELSPLEEPWYDRHFRSNELTPFLDEYFEEEATRDLDVYFLMSRVLYPLVAAPEEPRFDHLCNALARVCVSHMQTTAGTTLLLCKKLRKRSS